MGKGKRLRNAKQEKFKRVTFSKYTTANVKQMVEAHKNNPEMVNYLLDGIDYYEAQYKKDKKKPNRESAANMYCLTVDRMIESSKKEKSNIEISKKIACKKGCSYCCYIHVGITDDEAYVLMEHAKDIGLKIDKEALKIQSTMDHTDWDTLPRKYQKCVFLGDDGCCSVYKHRPIACRKYLVLDSSEQCEKGPGNLARVYNDYRSEILASGVMNATKYGSMPKMILKEMENASNT